MTALSPLSSVLDTRFGEQNATAMDEYLIALDITDREVRAALVAAAGSEHAPWGANRSPTGHLRRLLAARCARALGRPHPQSEAAEAEAILAMVLSGAMRRHPKALLDPKGPDASRARRRAGAISVVVPPDRPCAMPVQSLHKISLRHRLAMKASRLRGMFSTGWRRVT